jgi:hypothetical protein
VKARAGVGIAVKARDEVDIAVVEREEMEAIAVADAVGTLVRMVRAAKADAADVADIVVEGEKVGEVSVFLYYPVQP